MPMRKFTCTWRVTWEEYQTIRILHSRVCQYNSRSMVSQAWYKLTYPRFEFVISSSHKEPFKIRMEERWQSDQSHRKRSSWPPRQRDMGWQFCDPSALAEATGKGTRRGDKDRRGCDFSWYQAFWIARSLPSVQRPDSVQRWSDSQPKWRTCFLCWKRNSNDANCQSCS